MDLARVQCWSGAGGRAKQIPSTQRQVGICAGQAQVAAGQAGLMEFVWPQEGLKVLKDTPVDLEIATPDKGVIAGQATGRWTSASDFQRYHPLKNVGKVCAEERSKHSE